MKNRPVSVGFKRMKLARMKERLTMKLGLLSPINTQFLPDNM
jgi:hypothetical protein